MRCHHHFDCFGLSVLSHPVNAFICHSLSLSVLFAYSIFVLCSFQNVFHFLFNLIVKSIYHQELIFKFTFYARSGIFSSYHDCLLFAISLTSCAYNHFVSCLYFFFYFFVVYPLTLHLSYNNQIKGDRSATLNKIRVHDFMCILLYKLYTCLHSHIFIFHSLNFVFLDSLSPILTEYRC